MKSIVIAGEHQLPQVASEIQLFLNQFDVLCFNGEMGAGKTTLIKVLCEQLGVEDAMSSPTYAIVNEYLDGKDHPIYHFDFYRIESNREALDIGVDEYLNSGELCLLEWSERIKDLLPEEYLEISIKLEGDNGRSITITPHGG
ncbi:MAG: tRNA (adenosine(37)-N6)-threonylcarbamoyltransferase complex ATPase subunit type 1 TsaE [Cyclobacteriaceae bacterium]